MEARKRLLRIAGLWWGVDLDNGRAVYFFANVPHNLGRFGPCCQASDSAADSPFTPANDSNTDEPYFWR